MNRSEWLARCAPAKPLEACTICSKIPPHCSRFEKGGELVGDDIPPETRQLVGLLGPVRGWRGEIMQCPECRRPYWFESEYEFLVGGSEDTWTYRRMAPEELFREDWFTRYRFGHDKVELAWAVDCFPHHVIAELKLAGWAAMHDEGAVTPLASVADLVTLGPTRLDDPAIARRYLYLVDRMRARPQRYVLPSFDRILWKWKRTPEEDRQIEDLRAASRVEPEQVVREDGRVLVTQWFVHERRLICRIASIFAHGDVHDEELVVGEDLPVY